MRKLLTLIVGLLAAQSAFAADLPVKSAPYVAAPLPMWDGFYVGVMGGYIWNNSNTSFTGNDPIAQFALDNGIVPTSLHPNATGGFVGGTIGHNKQYGGWILGIELDAAWASAKKDNASLFSEQIHYPEYIGGSLGSIDVATNVRNQLDWFGTIRGRVGYLLTPTTLLFATGGLAVAQIEAQSSHSLSIGGYNIATASGVFNDTRAGWTVGAGVEQKLWDRLSLKAEYRHMDFGTANWSASTSLIGILPVQFNAQADLKYDLALIGLNYHW